MKDFSNIAERIVLNGNGLNLDLINHIEHALEIAYKLGQKAAEELQTQQSRAFLPETGRGE